jgi:hypothetical protein
VRRLIGTVAKKVNYSRKNRPRGLPAKAPMCKKSHQGVNDYDNTPMRLNFAEVLLRQPRFPIGSVLLIAIFAKNLL